MSRILALQFANKIFSIKHWVIIGVYFLTQCFVSLALAQKPSGIPAVSQQNSTAQVEAIKIAVFDAPLGHKHSRDVIKLMRKKLRDCSSCQIELFPIYDQSGTLNLNLFKSGLEKINNSYALVHLSWNMPYEMKFDPIIEQLNRIVKSGIAVVAAAGESQQISEIAVPVSKTVMAQVKSVVLVAELDQHGKIPIRAYYGSEITHRIPSVKNYPGSSFTAVIVSSRMAIDIHYARKHNK